MKEGTDLSAVLPQKRQKAKVYGVDADGNQLYICEANICEEVPSGMDKLKEKERQLMEDEKAFVIGLRQYVADGCPENSSDGLSIPITPICGKENK